MKSFYKSLIITTSMFILSFFAFLFINLNQIKPAHAQTPGCTVNISSVAPGGSVTVTSVNGLFGSIGIQGGYGSPVFSALGTLTAGGSTPITIPSAAPAGLYVVRVGGYGVGCTPNLDVTTVATPAPTPPPGTPGCTVSASSVAAGGTVTITSVNSLFGSIGIQGGYGTPVFSALGTLTAGGSTPITIPSAAPAGLYVVRVGGYAVGCTPNITVTAAGGGGTPGCTVSASSVAAGGTVTITSVNGLFGSIGIQGGYGTPVYSNLGDLIANTSIPITVPSAAELGLYVVRVGGYGVGCTPNITVTAAGGGGGSPAPITGTSCSGFFDCLTGILSPTTAFSENGFIGAVFSSILPIAIGLGGFLSVIIIVISGIQFIASNGNPEAAAAARSRLIFAIIGFALLILAFAITQIVNSVFLHTTGVVGT